jgi:hypothetical protein
MQKNFVCHPLKNKRKVADYNVLHPLYIEAGFYKTSQKQFTA